MPPKYILQFGSLAGWPYTLANALTKAGCPSANVISEDVDVGDLDRRLPYHKAINHPDDNRFVKHLRRLRFAFESARNCSLVHYHGGVIWTSFYHHLFEGPLFRSRAIPMLMTFGGGDARLTVEARALNRFSHREPDPGYDERIKRYLSSISRCVRYIATDCEMARYTRKYFDEVFVFRQPVDLEAFSFVPPRTDRPPILLHTPTYTWVKGTEHIVSAVEKLKEEGYEFEFRMRRQLTQRELFSELARCDVYVDELRVGSHGMTAVEALAYGKPTVSHIREDLLAEYPPELPIVSATPENVYEKLRALVADAGMRRELSYRSRAYAEKYHDAAVVARDMLEVYRKIGL